MYKYAILPNKGNKFIYFDAAIDLVDLEIKAILLDVFVDFEIEKNESLKDFIVFSTKEKLSFSNLKKLKMLSIFYVIFEILEGDVLKPISISGDVYFNDSINQILKYNGKTNEQFTRLMVNLAVSACDNKTEKLKLLDPMCGKGTTLYEGLIRGFDVVGIDINVEYFKEIKNYLLRYLKNGKYKHSIESGKISQSKGKKIGEQFTITTASSKELYINKQYQTIKAINGNTKNTSVFIKKNYFDIIVCDLPYGVKHGSKEISNTYINRSPAELISESICFWADVLKVSGSMVISFNEYTLKYDVIKKECEKVGLLVLDKEPYYNYFHRVDQAINRNLIVVKKISV